MLPAPDIVLLDPTPSDYHVALPASVRPLTFHAQGVVITSALLPTDAMTVAAF